MEEKRKAAAAKRKKEAARRRRMVKIRNKLLTGTANCQEPPSDSRSEPDYVHYAEDDFFGLGLSYGNKYP